MSTEISIIKIDEITPIMQNAGTILNKNIKVAQVRIEKAQALIDTAAAEGMSEDLDKDMNDAIVGTNKAIIWMRDQRKPVTQMMTLLSKEFTTREALLDVKTVDGPYFKLQKLRDDYHTKKANTEKERIAAINLQKNKDLEKISFTTSVESALRKIYTDKLFQFKTYLTNQVNKITLDNVEVIKENITKVQEAYSRNDFNMYDVTGVGARYLDALEKANIIGEVKARIFDEIAANFKEEMVKDKREALDKVPSKVREVTELKNADEATKKQLQDATEKREREEADELKQQQLTAEKQSEKTVELKQSNQESATLFNTAVQVADVKSESAAPTRMGYNIVCANMAGAAAIINFWFSKNSDTVSVDKWLKTSGDQMKAFCEKHALATGEKIDSEFVTYEDVYKAVAKK